MTNATCTAQIPETQPIAPNLPVEVHPAWCQSADLFLPDGRNVPCGDHFGEPNHIPATDSDFDVRDTGAIFPRIEVTPCARGEVPAVNITVFNPLADNCRDWVDAYLAPAVARGLAGQVRRIGEAAKADVGRTDLTVTVDDLDRGWVVVCTDGGSVSLAVVNIKKALALRVLMKPSEADAMAFALLRAIDVVEGR